MDIFHKFKASTATDTDKILKRMSSQTVEDTLKILKELRESVDALQLRIVKLEKKLEERFPYVFNDTWYESYQDGLVLDTSEQQDFYSEIRNINRKIAQLEKKIDEKIPERVLTEKKFIKEVQDSEYIVDKIISEIKNLLTHKPVSKHENGLTIVESRRINKILSILQQHGKMTSFQLSQFMDLSRTRCNEYFKKMENLGMVEPILIGKEKFYRIK